jgi:hypothetical protein
LFNRNSELIPIILYYVDDEYRSFHLNLFSEKTQTRNILLQSIRIAETNGLSYQFCKNFLENPFTQRNLGTAKAYLRKEEDNLNILKGTLRLVSHILQKEGIEFRFIKLYRQIPYAPRDVDILIRSADMRRVSLLLQNNGYVPKVTSNVEIKCQRPDMLEVDLYCGFYYLSFPFISDHFLWQRKRTVKIEGIDCYVPNPEADFLSLAIHSLLGHRQISLLDFLYAKDMLHSGLDLAEMREEAQKRGWAVVFNELLHLIHETYNSLYHDKEASETIDFPFVYPTRFVLKALREFPEFSRDTQKQLTFILSAFLDGSYHKYLRLSQTVKMEIPEKLKNVIGNLLFRVRDYRGDSKVPPRDRQKTVSNTP